jgi:hypothetical protein
MTPSDIDDPLSDPLPHEGAARVRLPTDLSSLCTLLARRFANDPPRGYVVGKTRMRDLLMSEMGFGASKAERMIDRLEAEGALVYDRGDRRTDDRSATWRFELGVIGRS